MLKWINAQLQKLLDRKKQDVIRLRWQHAKLQKELDKIKKNGGINDE